MRFRVRYILFHAIQLLFNTKFCHSLTAGIEVTVKIKHSCRSIIDIESLEPDRPRDFKSRILSNIKNKDFTLLQSVVGVTSDGREVIGLLKPQQQVQTGVLVNIDERLLIEKPANWKCAESSLLPHLSLSSLPILYHAGINQESAKGKICVVTGGHSPISAFIMCLLSTWGATVYAATTAKIEHCVKIGAKSAIDFRKKNFVEEVESNINYVIDTLGRESEGSISDIRKLIGATYVSLMPNILKLAVDEGLLFGGAQILSYKSISQNGTVKSEHSYWLPEIGGPHISMIRDVAQLASVDSYSKLHNWGANMGISSGELLSMQEYLEALSWPKDRDTGLRFGFPARTSDYWLEPSSDDEEDSSSLNLNSNFRSLGISTISSENEGVNGAAKKPPYKVIGGGVQEVLSADSLTEATRDGKAVLFLSSSSCRVCMYVGGYIRKLVPQYEDIKFLHMNVKIDPTLVSRKLGINAVPSFIAFNNGTIISKITSSDKKNILDLIEKL